MREAFDGTFMMAGFDAPSAAGLVEDEKAELVAFGVPYIANPDLPERYRLDHALNEPDKETYYGGGAKGYTDYPFMNES